MSQKKGHEKFFSISQLPSGGGDSLESVVVASVHMNIKTGVSTEIIELIVTSFTEKEILDAKTELLKKMGMDIPGGHRDTSERTAAYLYAKELVVLVHELDNADRWCPLIS